MDLLDQFIKMLQDFNDRLSNIGVTICDDGVLINANDNNLAPATVLAKDKAPFKPSSSKHQSSRGTEPFPMAHHY